MQTKAINILLVEDNPGDVVLTEVAFKRSKLKNHLEWVETGEAALAYLRNKTPYQGKPRPDIILLDLNLPKICGADVLKVVKADEDLRLIPVVILTSSDADEDIRTTYGAYANCFVTKPVSAEAFLEVAKTIEEFWFEVVRLPTS